VDNGQLSNSLARLERLQALRLPCNLPEVQSIAESVKNLYLDLTYVPELRPIPSLPLLECLQVILGIQQPLRIVQSDRFPSLTIFRLRGAPPQMSRISRYISGKIINLKGLIIEELMLDVDPFTLCDPNSLTELIIDRCLYSCDVIAQPFDNLRSLYILNHSVRVRAENMKDLRLLQIDCAFYERCMQFLIDILRHSATLREVYIITKDKPPIPLPLIQALRGAPALTNIRFRYLNRDESLKISCGWTGEWRNGSGEREWCSAGIQGGDVCEHGYYGPSNQVICCRISWLRRFTWGREVFKSVYRRVVGPDNIAPKFRHLGKLSL
jgi:hypothetical protein